MGRERDGRGVALAARPLEVLLYLARRRDRVVPRDELMERVWPPRGDAGL